MCQYLLEAGRTDVDLKRVLWQLAYEAYATSKPDDSGEALLTWYHSFVYCDWLSAQWS